MSQSFRPDKYSLEYKYGKLRNWRKLSVSKPVPFRDDELVEYRKLIAEKYGCDPATIVTRTIIG